MSAAMRQNTVGYTPGRGLPLGVPTDPEVDAASAQVSSEFARFREPNTPASPSSEVTPPIPRRRVGHQQLSRLEARLSERDRQVLHLIGEHRFLTTFQIQHFCFHDHHTTDTAARVTRRVLARLKRDELLQPLTRQVGGTRAGSEGTIWQLAPAGSRLAHGGSSAARRRPRDPSDRFLAHQLAVADVHVLLAQHRRIEAIEDVTVQVEPASWRRYQGPSGEPRWLQPDLAADITTEAFTDRFFIEVDLGSETLPTLLGKCEQYEAYRRTGIEQQHVGTFPLVVWLFIDEQRAHRLAQAIGRSSKLSPAMFRYATPDTLTHILAGGAA